MPEASIEKDKCGNCGVDVRENTNYCYNCGSIVVGEEDSLEHGSKGTEQDAKTKAALEDLENRFRIDDDEGISLAKAAAERKKARVSSRKTIKYEWEPIHGVNPVFIIFVAVFVLFAVMAVIMMVYW